MKTLPILALGAIFAVSALVSATEAEARCLKAGGTATGLTQDIAKTMATAALNQSISGHGGKASGKVAMKCDANMLMSTCTATQRVCK